LDRQAEPVAAHGSLHLRKQIDARFGIRIPQLAGMPWNRTLTATGQTNAAGAQIGAAAGIIKKMKQRYIPAAVYITTLIEFDKKEHRADDLQTLIDLSEAGAHFLAGEVGQPDNLIEHGLELDMQHFLDKVIPLKKQHALMGDASSAVSHSSYPATLLELALVRIRLRVPCLSSLKKRLWFRTALIPICNGASLQLWMAHRKRPICGCDQRRKPERLHGTYSCFGKQRQNWLVHNFCG